MFGGNKWFSATLLTVLALAAVLVINYTDDVSDIRLSDDTASKVVPEIEFTSAAGPQTVMKRIVQKMHQGESHHVPASVAVNPATAPGSFPELSRKSGKGVVQLMVVKAKHEWLAPEQPPTTEEVSGSGFFVDNVHLGLKDSNDLHIVTNAHVAIDAVRLVLRIPLLGLLPIEAEVVGLSPPDQFDLALLRVKSRDSLVRALKRKVGENATLEDSITTLNIGDSDSVDAGQSLMALGYPEGLPGVKSTMGVMSGYQQMGSKLYMQMTTPINPGNSGGPLLSHKGEVVGVNTAGLVKTQNIGFAIPAATLSNVLPVLAKTRTYIRPLFGIEIAPTVAHENRLFNLPEGKRGIYVTKVYEGSLADTAGIKPGDIIMEFAGRPMSRRGQIFLKEIQTYVSLSGYMSRVALGSHVPVEVWRDGKPVKTSLAYKITKPNVIPQVYEAALNQPRHIIVGGLVFAQLTQNYVSEMTTPVGSDGLYTVPAPNLMKYSNYPANSESPKVVIADVVSSSLAEQTKVFDSAMILKKVNGRPVSTLDELCEAMSHPIRDAKNAEWLTIVTDHDMFGAMPLKEAVANDKQSAATGLIRLSSCPASTQKQGQKQGQYAAKNLLPVESSLVQLEDEMQTEELTPEKEPAQGHGEDSSKVSEKYEDENLRLIEQFQEDEQTQVAHMSSAVQQQAAATSKKVNAALKTTAKDMQQSVHEFEHQLATALTATP